MIFDELMLFECPQKFQQIAPSKIWANTKLLANFANNFQFGGPSFQQLEDSRSDEIEVEHLTLPDIKDDGAVLAVGAAHCVGDAVHRKPHLLDVWWHGDTLRRVKTRKNRHLSVKRHRGRNVVWDQQDAAVVRGSARFNLFVFRSELCKAPSILNECLRHCSML